MNPALLNWGIISTARINDEVIPAIEHSSRSRLLGVASRDEQRARAYAAERGIPRSYGSYAALLADQEIDCVYISLPNSLHVPMASAALEAGKHVLCEKPLATSHEEAVGLIEQARTSGLILMEAFMYRHHDRTRLLRELVEGGAIGELQLIKSSFHFLAADPASDVRFRPELAGGALRDVGSYCVSLATHLMGAAPDEVTGLARLASSGVDEMFAGVLAFDGGAVNALFDCGMCSNLHIGVTLLGSEGSAHVATPWYPHLPPATIEIHRGEQRETIETSTDNPYWLEVENLCAAVAGETEPTVSAEETLRNLEVLDRLAAAARLPRYQTNPKGTGFQ